MIAAISRNFPHQFQWNHCLKKLGIPKLYEKLSYSLLNLFSKEKLTYQTTENNLCKLLSKIRIPLTGKKIIVYTQDWGGFGDFVFGFKALSVIQKAFSECQLALITDSPKKALKVQMSNFPVLFSQELLDSYESMGRRDLVSIIARESPDLLIIAPGTTFAVSRVKFPDLLKQECPTLSPLYIREYGWIKPNLGNAGDYVSGVGLNPSLTGIFISDNLAKWSEKADTLSVHSRLTELQNIPGPLQKAILGEEYSSEAIKQFASGNKLFMAYGALASQVEFMSAVTKMHSRLGTQASFTFVNVGASPDSLQDEIKTSKDIFQTLNVGKITIHEPSGKKTEISINAGSSYNITCIPSRLDHSGIEALIKASEKEIMTTGDQSWGEAVSANKHWIQEDISHKRCSLHKVIKLSHADLAQLFHKAFKEKHDRGKVDMDRIEAQANLLYQAKTSPKVAAHWDSLHHTIHNQYNIRPWLTGIVIKKLLENVPEFQELWNQALTARYFSDRQCDSFVQKVQNICQRVLKTPSPIS